MKMTNWSVFVLIGLIVAILTGCCGNCKAAETGDLSRVAETAALISNNASNIENAVKATRAATAELIENAPAIKSNLTEKAKAMGGIVAKVAGESKHGWGAEVGTMLREAGLAFVDTADGTLTVTEDHLYKFADSKVGKYTMFAIAWKLFASDAAQIGQTLMCYLLGIGILIGLTNVIWSMNRRMTTGTMIVTKKAGWGPFTKKTWEFKEASLKDDEAKTVALVVSWVAQAVVIIVALAVAL